MPKELDDAVNSVPTQTFYEGRHNPVVPDEIKAICLTPEQSRQYFPDSDSLIQSNTSYADLPCVIDTQCPLHEKTDPNYAYFQVPPGSVGLILKENRPFIVAPVAGKQHKLLIAPGNEVRGVIPASSRYFNHCSLQVVRVLEGEYFAVQDSTKLDKDVRLLTAGVHVFVSATAQLTEVIDPTGLEVKIKKQNADAIYGELKPQGMKADDLAKEVKKRHRMLFARNSENKALVLMDPHGQFKIIEAAGAFKIGTGWVLIKMLSTKTDTKSIDLTATTRDGIEVEIKGTVHLKLKDLEAGIHAYGPNDIEAAFKSAPEEAVRDYVAGIDLVFPAAAGVTPPGYPSAPPAYQVEVHGERLDAMNQKFATRYVTLVDMNFTIQPKSPKVREAIQEALAGRIALGAELDTYRQKSELAMQKIQIQRQLLREKKELAKESMLIRKELAAEMRSLDLDQAQSAKALSEAVGGDMGAIAILTHQQTAGVMTAPSSNMHSFYSPSSAVLPSAPSEAKLHVSGFSRNPFNTAD